MAQTLTTLSEELAAAVASAGAGVVRVEGRRRLPASGIIWSNDGLVLTANHALRWDSGIRVGLAGGTTAAAELVGRDPTTDLALLRLSGQAPEAAPLAPDDGLQVGHLVLALGRPGKSVQATLGIVSALGQSWRTFAGGQIDRYLQTDVVMYPGFSGGPLVNAAGQVLGLNSSALLRGVSLTVPASTLRQVATTLLAYGKVKRGFLGVSTQPVRLPGSLRAELGQETGLLLVSVEPDSPADKGGLLLGDTIVALDGQPVRHHDDLVALLSGDRVGQKVPLQVVRGGQALTLDVVIGERT